MKTAITANRSGLIAGVAATLAVAALGFAGAAQARDNVSFSVGIGVPGVQVGVTNAYPCIASRCTCSLNPCMYSLSLCMCSPLRFTSGPVRSITASPFMWHRRFITAARTGMAAITCRPRARVMAPATHRFITVAKPFAI